MARKRSALSDGERRDEPVKVFVTVDDLRAILAEVTQPVSEAADEAIGRVGEAMVLALRADAITYSRGD